MPTLRFDGKPVVAAERRGGEVVAKIIATYSPCCGIFHAGDAKEGVMHCALPHDRATVRLVDVAELDHATKRIKELESWVVRYGGEEVSG
jgi:hypothetical protein